MIQDGGLSNGSGWIDASIQFDIVRLRFTSKAINHAGFVYPVKSVDIEGQTQFLGANKRVDSKINNESLDKFYKRQFCNDPDKTFVIFLRRDRIQTAH